MDKQTINAKTHFVEGMIRISNFWGLPKAMGAIYGTVYLSPEPISLDDMVSEVGVSKGAVSTNIRHLERLGLVHKHIQVGDRKDFYTAETDFWLVVRRLLKERQKSEFDKAINTVEESFNMLTVDSQSEVNAFYRERISAIQSFFNTLDTLVLAIVKFENLVSLSALKSILEKGSKKK